MGEKLRAAIDIGNTRIKCGVFDGRQIMQLFVTETEDELYNFLQQKNLASVIISDVRGGTNIPDRLGNMFPVILMNSKLKLPIKNNYISAETLGTDRICAAVGAAFLYTTQTILVVDAGTCITLGFVDAHIYKGGSISPGINMRYQSLHHYTGKLPYLKTPDIENVKATGLDTPTSIHAGVLAGAVYEVQGRLNAIIDFEKIEEQYTIVTTGGDGAFLAEQLKYCNFANLNKLIFEPNLVLVGLNEILLLNEFETT